MDWTPTLGDRTGPVYLRIVEALTDDIAAGRLRRGQQLPTHRTLAKALGVDLTTVTRAYNEARQRGLTEARVGQGTFVAESLTQVRHPEAPRPAFDLSMNLPPQPLDADLEGRIIRGLAAIQRESGFAAYLNYREAGGNADEREAAAAWLAPRIATASGERLRIFPGTQSAIFTLLQTLLSPGDVVVTEALTYPGLKSAAATLGLSLIGVAMDRFGMLPDALDAACRRHAPKAVYLVPTMHNPTTATLPPSRRARIAEIIASHGAILLEDDAYGGLAPEMAPLAALIPERSYYMASLSKCIAPGLRRSFLLAPNGGEAARLSGALRTMVQMPVPLMTALVTRWLRDGSADAIVAAIRAEAQARQALAAQALAGHAFAAHPSGHHIWVPLPSSWNRTEFAAHVQRQGVVVVTSEAFSVSEPAPHAMRVALGAAASRADLVRALELLAAALKAPSAIAHVI